MLSKKRRAQEMLKMLRLNIACTVKQSGEVPSLVNECFTKALHAKHHLTLIYKEKKTKKEKAKGEKAHSKLKNMLVQAKAKRILTFPTCNKCGKAHPEGCKSGTNLYFKCGKEGHFAGKCVANQLKITNGVGRYHKNSYYCCK